MEFLPLFTDMCHEPDKSPMLHILSQAVRALGSDTANEVSLHIVQLKASRCLGRIEASSISEAWLLLLTNMGIRQPDHYVSRLARRIRSKRDWADANHRVLAKRRALDLKAPKRLRTRDTPEPEWIEPKAPDSSSSAAQPERNSILKEIERRDDFLALHEELRWLSVEDQTLIKQVYWDHQPQSTIAHKTGQSPSAVRSRLDRIRDHLSKRLADRWGEQPYID